VYDKKLASTASIARRARWRTAIDDRDPAARGSGNITRGTDFRAHGAVSRISTRHEVCACQGTDTRIGVSVIDNAVSAIDIAVSAIDIAVSIIDHAAAAGRRPPNAIDNPDCGVGNPEFGPGQPGADSTHRRARSTSPA